jgi:hypothetical protein
VKTPTRAAQIFEPEVAQPVKYIAEHSTSNDRAKRKQLFMAQI